jgi:hypothetical protein
MISRVRLKLRGWCVKGTQQSRRFHLSEILRVLSYVLFLLSLIAVAVNRARGYQILLYGPVGLVWFSVNWPWLGNPALFAAWVTLAKRANTTAAVFSTAALVAAARVFSIPELISDYESGGADKIEYLGPGYWLWSASMVCALIAALIRLSMPKPGFYEEDN